MSSVKGQTSGLAKENGEFANDERRKNISTRRFTFYVLRFALLFLLPGLLFLLSPLPLTAQSLRDAEVEFFVESPTEEEPITVGDQVVLRLEIIHPADSRVVLPQLEEQWESFIVVDQSPPETVNQGDGMAVTGKDITVSLFQPGEYETPPVVVTHRKPDGSIEELAAPIIPIRVTSVLTEGSELQDLKPQAALPEPALWPWILAGLILVALLAVGLAFLTSWLRRRWQQRPEPAFVPVPFVDSRPPEIIAHAELDRIEALELPARNQIKGHYSLVATCIRRYIEGRYGIKAVEQTTDELRSAFNKSEVAGQEISRFMNLVTESDWVKFARYTPGPEETRRLIDRARTIVDDTTPRVVEEPETPPPPAEPEEMPV